MSFWVLGYLSANIMVAPCEKVCQFFYRRTGHTAVLCCAVLCCVTAPVSVHRCNDCLAGQFRRLWRHFPEGRKESTIVNYVSLVRAATGDQRKPGTVCLRKVDLTQRGGLGTVACLAGSPGCGGSPTQRATAVESSRVNGGRLSRPCAGTSSTVDLSEQQRTNSNQ